MGDYEKNKNKIEQCKHLQLDYLGEQEVNGFGDTISLYNCRNCHTTVMVKSIKEIKDSQLEKEVLKEEKRKKE